MNLTTNQSIQIVTTGTSEVHACAEIAVIDRSGASALVDQIGIDTQITTATTTTIVPAASSSTKRVVRSISLINIGTGSQTITVERNTGGTARRIHRFSLGPGERSEYASGQWIMFDVAGRIKNAVPSPSSAAASSPPYDIWKVGTAPEAAGQYYSWAKDAGTPGGWAPGTPGLAGRATNGTAAPDAGCVVLPTWTSGTGFISQLAGQATVACRPYLIDVLWVNSGIVVTTTTAQTINSVTLPARDSNGATLGVDCRIGLLVTTATTNGAAITNMSVTYTNTAGTGSRTATPALGNFPATAVIGTFVPFHLASGDLGVQSIQSITLGTTLTAGAVSLVVYRPVAGVSLTLANTPYQSSAGASIAQQACLLPIGLMSATTATTLVLTPSFQGA